MLGAFGEKTEAQEQAGKRPNQPAGAARSAQADPAGECHAEEGNINSLDLRKPAFLDDARAGEGD